MGQPKILTQQITNFTALNVTEGPLGIPVIPAQSVVADTKKLAAAYEADPVNRFVGSMYYVNYGATVIRVCLNPAGDANSSWGTLTVAAGTIPA